MQARSEAETVGVHLLWVCVRQKTKAQPEHSETIS